MQRLGEVETKDEAAACYCILRVLRKKCGVKAEDAAFFERVATMGREGSAPTPAARRRALVRALAADDEEWLAEGAQHWRLELDALEEATGAMAAATAVWAALG